MRKALFLISVITVLACGDVLKSPSQRPPVAVAGANGYNIYLGTEVSLIGVDSSDIDENALTYLWSIVNAPDGSTATLSDTTTVNTSFTPDVVGTYDISLVVNDGTVDSEPDFVTITASYAYGSAVKTIPYPSGITKASDIIYNKAADTLWIVGESGITPLSLIEIDKASDDVIDTILLSEEKALFYDMTWDGQYFWTTGYGWLNGPVEPFIFKIDSTGAVIGMFLCPASDAGGICQGLAWDGTYLWSGAADNKNLVQFSTDGTVQRILSDVFDTVGVYDIAYDSATGNLLVSKNHLFIVDPVSGDVVSDTGVYVYKGDWDGEFFWRADNSTQEIKAIYIGPLE